MHPNEVCNKFLTMQKNGSKPGISAKNSVFSHFEPNFFPGVSSKGSHKNVLKSSNFELKDGPYAIVLSLGV